MSRAQEIPIAPEVDRALERARELVSGARPHLDLTTSGSTAAARTVRLGRTALLASAHATHERLGGPGDWLLCLPAHHIAGTQVLIRGLLAQRALGRSALWFHDDSAGFSPASFLRAVRAIGDEGSPARRYVSLVPTQLTRLLADPAATAELATFAAVLIGGAATDAGLLEAARAAGIVAVTTYGMTETCGGCVYDRVPLDGVEVRVRGGRIELRGPVVADGYVGSDGCIDEVETGRHLSADGWWRTQDRGEFAGGELTVTGRADDVIISGGVNVDPGAVAGIIAGLLADPGLRVAVCGIPDAEWGQRVVAVVGPQDGIEPHRAIEPQGGGPAAGFAPVRWEDERSAPLRTAVRTRLGVAAAPSAVVSIAAWPLTDLGKIDRVRLRALVASTEN